MIGRLVAGLVLMVGCSAAGCSEPCRELAGRICDRVGTGDPLCVRLRSIAAAPRAGDLEACRAGNDFVDELQRGR